MCVLLSDRENLCFQRDGPDESICAMSIACHQSSAVSLKKERERETKKEPEKERDQPTMEDLHESCHLTLIDSNYDTNKIS